jgi:hypothetical protein
LRDLNRRKSSSIRDKRARDTKEIENTRELSRPEELQLEAEKPIFS